MYIFCVCCFWGWGSYPFYSASKEYRQPKHCLLKKNEDPILHAERQRENTVQPLKDCTVFMYHRVT